MTDQEQIDALKAQVNCLRDALLNTIMYREGTVNYGDPLEALESTPEQCLAEVKAKAIEDYKNQLAKLGNGDKYGNSIGNTIAINALAKTLEQCLAEVKEYNNEKPQQN